MKKIYTAILTSVIVFGSVNAFADDGTVGIGDPAPTSCLSVDDVKCQEIDAHIDMRIQELFAICTVINKSFKHSELVQHCYKLSVETAFFEAYDMKEAEGE